MTGVADPAKLPIPEFKTPDGICIVKPVAVDGGFELEPVLKVESMF